MADLDQIKREREKLESKLKEAERDLKKGQAELASIERDVTNKSSEVKKAEEVVRGINTELASVTRKEADARDEEAREKK